MKNATKKSDLFEAAGEMLSVKLFDQGKTLAKAIAEVKRVKAFAVLTVKQWKLLPDFAMDICG